MPGLAVVELPALLYIGAPKRMVVYMEFTISSNETWDACQIHIVGMLVLPGDQSRLPDCNRLLFPIRALKRSSY